MRSRERALILDGNALSLDLIPFTENLIFRLGFDGLGRFFAGILATLWPLTTLYSFEYLDDDPRVISFYTFFSISYGTTLGIAMAGDLFTLYIFYELLTLSTAPLVIHTMSRDAIRAGSVYFAYFLGGAAFALPSMLFLISDYYLTASAAITRLFFVFGFFGFGVKAAVFPIYKWLPKASVAPTPVTALLHAVAVVNAGVFALVRLIYCCYGTEVIAGSWAQYLPMAMVLFTILYGSSRALKETHWKRRLAYSTVANLSYILFGVLLLSEEGLTAGLLHMAFHSEIKILAFFCAGAVLHHTEKQWINELSGLGKVMPVTFACFTVAALALTGIPPFSGFISKWALLTAGMNSESVWGYAGIGVILIAALLTAIYMFTTVRKAWFPGKGSVLPPADKKYEAGPFMLIPMVILAAAILVTGLFSDPITGKISAIVSAIPRWY